MTALLQHVLDVLERGEVLCEVTAANMLRAAIEQGAVVQQWQTMDSAPNDGTSVLVYGPWAGEIAGESGVSVFDIARWCGGKSDFAGDDWWSASTGDAYACWIKATHWQPLPTAPKEQA